MVLAELLQGVRVIKLFSHLYGRMALTQDISVRAIQYDSRRVEHGDVFVAILGTAFDGHKFVESAIARGAVAVVMQNDDTVPDALFMHAGVMKLVVPDSRVALAVMSANYYSHPSRKLRLIGVTGTNGKTTTSHLIKSILESAGMKTGLIGTIGYKIGEETLPATHTTPESLELNKLLATMVERGCTAAVMEVSSHALALRRIYGLEFAAAAFTNLTQDHLDFHGTMDSYFEAKKILFDNLTASAVAVTNADDPYGRRIVQNTSARVVTYGSKPGADVVVRDVHLDVTGLTAVLAHGETVLPITSRLTGGFNIENILAAGTVAFGLGIPEKDIKEGIAALPSVRGRLEQIVAPAGWTAVIDYAHTPDALEKCLHTLRNLMPAKKGGRIITVFGCGGNRDAGKRPIMGRIVSSLSDVTIITSDNPRHEEPEAIIREIQTGVLPSAGAITEPDRRKAIVLGLSMARPGDIVLLAGKGHEDYQVIGDVRFHFDDREEVETFLRSGS